MKQIEEAKKYYRVAIDELNEAKKDDKTELAVDGCEKGWLAVVLATNALFLNKGEKRLPRAQRGRMYLLVKHGTKELRTIFYKARDILHIAGFYEQIIDYDTIFECLADVKEYIDKIANEKH